MLFDISELEMSTELKFDNIHARWL